MSDVIDTRDIVVQTEADQPKTVQHEGFRRRGKAVRLSSVSRRPLC